MGYFRENIEKLEAYTPGFQPADADTVKLNTNENPYPPSPLVMEALAAISTEQLRRYPQPNTDIFRRPAAEVNDVQPENIICGNGADELLTMVFRAFCDKDRPAAYPVPTYSLYQVLARAQRCKTIEVPFDEQFNLPAELAETGAALTSVCNPNAPSGSLVKPTQLASLADKLTGILLIDEAYVDFAETTCTELVKDFDNVIILRSMSKGYSLAGVRFGYAIGQPELINGLMKIKDSYNVDAVAAAVAVAAIKDREYFKKNIEKVKENRRKLTAELRKLKLEVPDSSANFVIAGGKNFEAKKIYDKLSELNIYVRYFALPKLDDKLRITVGTSEQNEKLISALQEILSE